MRASQGEISESSPSGATRDEFLRHHADRRGEDVDRALAATMRSTTIGCLCVAASAYFIPTPPAARHSSRCVSPILAWGKPSAEVAEAKSAAPLSAEDEAAIAVVSELFSSRVDAKQLVADLTEASADPAAWARAQRRSQLLRFRVGFSIAQ